MSRFRSGCHGLRIDTGRWENNAHLDRKDGLCLVCSSAQQVEDELEHHFCLVALHIAPFELVMPIFFRVPVQYLIFLTIVKQMYVVDSLGMFFPKEQYLDWMNFVCWSVCGPQDYIHYVFCCKLTGSWAAG